MAELDKSQQRTQGIEAWGKQVDEDVKDVRDHSEVKGSISDVKTKLADLKAQVGDDTEYAKKRAEVETAYNALLEKAQSVRDVIRGRLTYVTDLSTRISEEISVDAEKNIPIVGTKVLEIKKYISEVSKDPTKYDTLKVKFDEFENFFADKLPTILAQFVALNDIQEDLKFIGPTHKTEVKMLLDKIKKLREGLGVTTTEEQVKNMPGEVAILKDQDERTVLLDQRSKKLKEAKDQAKIAIKPLEPKVLQALCEILNPKEKTIDKLADVFAKMILEGDGLSADQIVKFYTKNKDVTVKVTTQENIDKWVQEINDHNTSGALKGKDVSGYIPEDMERAIKEELRGPNTLKMMEVASDRYNKEFNDYLANKDNKDPLRELGFTNDEFFSNDAGENLDLTTQERKLVFLKSYISVLSAIIQGGEKGDVIPSWIIGLMSSVGSTMWEHYILSGFLLTVGVLVTKHLIVKGGGKIGKALWESEKNPLKSFLKVQSNFQNMMLEKKGRLNIESRNYVLGNIKLIKARIALTEGATITFEGDTYDKLSKEEGEKRIKAIETAVGSAIIANAKTPEIIPKGMRSTRFKIYRANPNNEDSSEDCNMNKALINFVQNMSRAPQMGLGIWEPNSRYLEQDSAALVWNAGLVRVAEAAVPIASMIAMGGPLTGAGVLAGIGGLGALSSVRRTMIAGALRIYPSKQQGFYLEKEGGKRNRTFKGIDDAHKMVERIGKALLEDKGINLLAEKFNLKGLSGEFLNLRLNTSVFNSPEEIKLLDDLERALKAAGGMQEKAWKYTIVRMGFICRGKFATNAEEIAGFPNNGTINTITALETAAAAAYSTLTASEQKELNELYDQILTGKNSKGEEVSLTPEQIIKCGELTKSRVTLTGTVGENGILQGKGRDAMDVYEKGYYEDGTYADAAAFGVAYEKWFSDYGKQCSSTYDAKKHLRLLNTQKKLLDFMDEHGAYAQDLKDGKKSKVDADILKKIKAFVDPDAVIKDDTEFTKTFKAQYDKKLAKLQDIAKKTAGDIARQINSLKLIDDSMNLGTIKNRHDYETKIRLALDAITVDEVLFDYVNTKAGVSPTTPYTNRLDAIDGFCQDRLKKYDAKMVAMRSKITSAGPNDWKTKLEALAQYRKYEDSDQPESDGNDGEVLVRETYKAIHAAIDGLTEPVDIEAAHKKLTTKNPESYVTDPRVPNSDHAEYIHKLEKKVNGLRQTAKREISRLFVPGNYSDVVLQGADAGDSMTSKFHDDIDAIRTKYGVELCTSPSGVDELAEAESKFTKIQSGYRAARSLVTRIEGGEFKRDAEIASAVANFQSAPAYADYLASFQGNFDAMISQAKIAATNARDAARNKTTPAVPPANETSPAGVETPEMRQKSVQDLSERIAKALEQKPGDTRNDQERLVDLFEVLTPVEQSVFHDLNKGLGDLASAKGEKLEFDQALNACVHGLIHAAIGDVSPDIVAQHKALMALPNIDVVNANLTRAHIERIEENVNVHLEHVRGKK